MIKVTVVGDSINSAGKRLTSLLCTFPRFILAEVNTHRAFSRNSASSRAIPFKKMYATVLRNPCIPYVWMKDHPGMQGTEFFEDLNDLKWLKEKWLQARDKMLDSADELHQFGLTKQLANRLLEPFMWHTALISSTEWENFFDLRAPSFVIDHDGITLTAKFRSAFENILKYKPKSEVEWAKMTKGAAEHHFMILTEQIREALRTSVPQQLQKGDWHIVFEDKIQTKILYDQVRVGTAMAARTSYTVIAEEKEITEDVLVKIHDRMYVAVPIHASPFEHCAVDMGDTNSYFNFTGFKQYRQIIREGKQHEYFSI